ncbi:MAG: hypothetical protein IPH04_15630 [Saprospirales bacterium]|jgi:nicotinate phosphoribosyltransferase|nr:hypothetical protein [Saprospirales bacterium]
MHHFLDPATLLTASLLWKSGQYDQPSRITLLAETPAVARGQEEFLSWVGSIRFSPDQIQRLGALQGSDGYSLFDESFLNYLQRFSFQCEVVAVAEGTSVFPGEPLVRISGPAIQVQMMQPALIGLIGGAIMKD